MPPLPEALRAIIADDEPLARRRLASLLEQEPDITIVRISRVKELEPYFHGDYSVTLHDGTRLRLSRTYRARLQAALGQDI